MAELPPEELGREIDRLWAKVGVVSADPWEALAPTLAEHPSAGRELAWETMAILKRQHRNEGRHWTELLAAKEKALLGAQERAAALEVELNSLRETLACEGERFITEAMAAQASAEAALKALKEEREKSEREQQALEGVLTQTRQRVSEQAAQLRREREAWARQDGEQLAQVNELEAKLAVLQKSRAEALEQVKQMSERVDEAKHVLEKTLAELLEHRRLLAQSEAQREEAVKKERAWQESDARSRERLEREAAGLAGQRAELAAMEAKLSAKREAWELSARDKDVQADRIAGELERRLRESDEKMAWARSRTFWAALIFGVTAGILLGKLLRFL